MLDMISNNFNGYLFKTNSYIDCSNKIKKISSSYKKLSSFSKNSIKIFDRNFSRRNIEKKLLKVYSKN